MGANFDALSIKSQAEQISEQIIGYRRLFHQIPELKMETILTEQNIVKILKDLGVTEIKQGVGGHGVIAIIRGTQGGKTIGVRADCDGLPIKEETNLEFKSTNGNMHACGHDVHTATALGAVQLIIQNKEHLKYDVKFIFQPYEEGGGGAKLMIEDGAMQNPAVDEIIAMHVHVKPNENYKVGDVLVSSEPTSAGIYSYEATFEGKQAHVCESFTAINCVHAACTAVAEIAKISKSNKDVVNAVTLVSGGVRNNIIPKSCTISGSIRSFDAKLHNDAIAKFNQIVNDSASKFGCTVSVKKVVDLVPMNINKTVYEKFKNIVNNMFSTRGAVEVVDKDLIGEDFATFSNLAPATHFFLHAKPQGEYYPLHNAKFDVDESVLHKASAVLAAFALYN